MCKYRDVLNFSHDTREREKESYREGLYRQDYRPGSFILVY